MALWQLKRLRRLVEQDVQTVSQLPVARIDMEMSIDRWATTEVHPKLPLISVSYPMKVDAGMMKYMQQQKIIEAIDYWRAYRQGEDIQASELIDLMPEDVRSIFDERARQQPCLIDDYLMSELSEQELELIEVQLRTLYRYSKDYLNQHPEDQIKVMHWQSIRARRVYEAYNQVSYQRSLATASRTLARCIQLYQQLGTMHIDQVPCSASVKRLRKNIDVTDVSSRPGS